MLITIEAEGLSPQYSTETQGRCPWLSRAQVAGVSGLGLKRPSNDGEMEMVETAPGGDYTALLLQWTSEVFEDSPCRKGDHLWKRSGVLHHSHSEIWRPFL